MQYFVYVLFGRKDKQLYIGFTQNVERRLKEHMSGQVSSTRFRQPLELLHYEAFSDWQDAKSRETFLKSGAGHRQLYAKLRRTLAHFI